MLNMKAKLTLSINVLLISLAISATDTKNKIIKWRTNNNLSFKLPFASTEPPLLEVMSCFVQGVRFMVLIIVDSNAEMVDGLLPMFHRQFQVPILLSRVDLKESSATEIAADTCHQCADVNIVYVIMLDNVSILDQYWDRIKKAQFVWNREANFLLLATSQTQTNQSHKVTYGETLEFLWTKYKILHVYIMPIFKNITQEVSYQAVVYQPFVPNYNKSFGAVQFIDGKDICKIKENMVLNKLKNMNGYPFAVSMFEKGKLINETSNRTESFYGQDGYILSELAKYMGFTTTILHPPMAKDFGFYYSNGSSTGTLGLVLQGKAEIAFNTRFIMDYGTRSIAFTTSIFNDDLCILVPKASYIPKWLAMARSFDKYIYATILLFYVACAYLWCVFKKIIDQYCKDKAKGGKDIASLFLDNLRPYVSMSFIHIPNTSSERLLMTCSMILGLILVSAFQSQLVTAISKPTYYQDINTLEQLDKSGLLITTSSRNLQVSFANTGNAVLDHLRMKITVVNDSFGLDRVARRGNVAAFVRKSTVESKGLQPNQRVSKLVHLVRECPRSYHLSYIMFKNSPYLSRVNRFLVRIHQAGIITHFKSKVLNDFKRMDKENTTTHHVVNATKVFTIEDLQLPFFLLIVGLALGSFVFLTEKL